MGDVIVLSVLGLVISFIVYMMIRKKRSGKIGCSSCSGCVNESYCSKKK